MTTSRDAARPAPLARLRLQRVQLRATARAAGVPVFHVFEELFTRALENPRRRPAPQQGARI